MVSSSFFRHEISPRTVPRPSHYNQRKRWRVVPVERETGHPGSLVPILGALPLRRCLRDCGPRSRPRKDRIDKCRPFSMLGGSLAARHLLMSLPHWPSEAKFVAIRIGQVKEPLTPIGIARWRVWSITGRDHIRIEGINIGMVEDDTPPPRPFSFRGLCDQIEKAGSSPKARKCCAITTTNDLKSQRAVESDGTRHVVRGQRNGTDALDHCGTSPFFILTPKWLGASRHPIQVCESTRPSFALDSGGTIMVSALGRLRNFGWSHALP